MQHDNNKSLNETLLFKERLTIALKTAKICVFEVDLINQLYTFFENSEDIFGVSGDIILNDIKTFSKLNPLEYRLAISNYFSHPDDEAIIAKAFGDVLKGQSTSYEVRMRAGGSNYRWCKIDVTPVLKDDKPIKMIGVITDISHIKYQNDLLKERATLDNFTGMYHKDYSVQLINECLNRQGNQSHAFILLDIDNFKSYNDTFGHLEGDKAIISLATLIKKTFRTSDIRGRFGGDEFMILIKNFPNKTWLCGKINPILQFQTCSHSLTTSIGVSIYPQDATTYEDLLKKADKALYCSKDTRKKFTFFSDLETE